MSRTGRNDTGFTFVEISIVMAILLSISGLLSIWLGNFLASKELQMEALKISSVSNLAREYAGAKGANYRMAFDLSVNSFRVEYFDIDGTYKTVDRVKKITLKDTVFVKSFYTPRSYYYDLAGGLSQDYVTFYPDGSAESALIVLQNIKGEVYSIYFAATTGMVKVYNYEVSIK